MTARILLTASAALALLQADAAAAAPSPHAAALQGKFALDGRVTVADDVPGERAGQTFKRTWSFRSACPTGQCSTAVLTRARFNGNDRLTLRRRSPGYYAGSGRFYAPARCGSRVYPRGILVPFTIGVRITAATLFGSRVIASHIRASYTNRSRRNLTPCVSALGHDSATYHGHLVGPA